MRITDDELVRLIVEKNQPAFDELIKRYGGLIKAIVRYHLYNISMWQEDCINDILFAVWQNIDKFDPERNSLKNWIGAVSKYRAINYKRKFYKELTECELKEETAYAGEVNTDLLKDEIDEEITSLLAALKPIDREIFIRYYIYEASTEDISASLNKKPAWIYNRISRGKKKLRKIYSEKGQVSYEK